MSNSQTHAVSPQARKLYQLLSKYGAMSAKQLAKRLDIAAPSVYRTTTPLLRLGMIQRFDTYPIMFRAKPLNDALSWYVRTAARDFRQDFARQTSGPATGLPSLTFIRDREHLTKLVEQEALKSKTSINYIVSGHRVPDSNVLAYRKATTLGVKARAIVQNDPRQVGSKLEDYAEMGVHVRHMPEIGIRLFVFDGRSAILTSYDVSQSSQAFGIHFSHPAVAQQLDHLFEQRWNEATPLS